jgi:hypothetical protein
VQIRYTRRNKFQIGATFNCMNNSNSSSDPTSPRVTLKLKVGARKTPKEAEKPSLPQSQSKANQQPHGKANQKPGAHWSDAYKERMQADMDSLISR